MLRFLGRRAFGAGIGLLALVALAFALIVLLAPGNPAEDTNMSPEILARIARVVPPGLPLYAQFGRYLWGALHFDFGPSLRFRGDVSALLLAGAPITLAIVLASLVAGLLIGVPLGSLAAARRGSLRDHAVLTLGMMPLAVPIFVGAPALQLVFGLSLRLLPTNGWDGGAAHAVLPVAALALPLAAAILRLTRRALPEAGSAAGAWSPDRLRAGSVACFSRLGPLTAGALIGSVLIDRSFALPGAGRILFEAMRAHDYTLIAGGIVCFGGLIILGQFVGDLCRDVFDRQRAISVASKQRGRPPVASIWSVPRRDGVTACAIVLVAAIAASCFLVPFFLPFRAEEMDWDAASAAPSWTSGHLLGADELGQDLLARVLVGGGASLWLAFRAAAAAGMILFARRLVAALAARFAPRAAWPSHGVLHLLPILIGVVAVQWAIGPLLLPRTLLVTFGMVWVMLPLARESQAPSVVLALLALPDFFLGAFYLGAQGGGVSDAAVDWGGLLGHGVEAMELQPLAVIAPAMAAAITFLCLNLVAERSRDVYSMTR
jgi:oligopeptide transport system permease protein